MKRTTLLLLGLLVVGCYPYSTDVKLCHDAVPEGGCPTGRGGTCEDPACNALYDCIDGEWKKIRACEAGGGAGGGTAGSGGVTASGGTSMTGGGGTGGCAPIMFDHTGETTGCTPDLQAPDCPAAAAEQCPESACLTDCTDFYLCKSDGADKGWVAVAYCDGDGHVVAAPR